MKLAGAALLQPAPESAYFSEEKLREAIGVPLDLSKLHFEVACYNFPAYHPSPYMEKLFGKGWTEYLTLRNSRPLYPGHQMPRQPLWGYFNEADPAWAEREIDLASSHGIDAWIIDWYWHDGVQFYHEQLEQGFLKARNRSKLKFALMWANHDWKNLYPATSPNDAAVLLPQTHSEADLHRVFDYCIEHYFREPNYWRIDGGLVFGFFDLFGLMKAIPYARLQRVLLNLREKVAKAGLGKVHFQASHIYDSKSLKDLGFDSATQYHTFSYTYDPKKPRGGQTPYGESCAASVRSWKEASSKVNLPFFPDCGVGFDDSPRFGSGAHMCSERSPDQFERLLRAAKHFVASLESQKQKIVMLSAWNEWTEDHVLLPDTIYGYSYLEAVKRVFRG
jgi:hypothetical protein